MNYWIIKSDPETWAWEDQKRDGTTFWDGVRNYQARNNLKEMKNGDICLFYLSNKDKAICGECLVVKEHYQDPTTDDDRWVCVDVKYHRDFKRFITLKEMKETPELSEIGLIKQSRLSVIPLSESDYNTIIKLENA